MSETYMRVHVKAYMPVSLSLNFPWKWNNLAPSRPKYIIFIGYLKRGAWRGFKNPMNPNWIRHCMLMHSHSGYIIHENATRMYFKKYMGRVVLWIWAELSYKLGSSWHGPSFMWADLAWAELVLGRVVRNSFTTACVTHVDQVIKQLMVFKLNGDN